MQKMKFFLPVFHLIRLNMYIIDVQEECMAQEDIKKFIEAVDADANLKKKSQEAMVKALLPLAKGWVTT